LAQGPKSLAASLQAFATPRNGQLQGMCDAALK